ncbi:hypothetical protein [Corynebacterium aurimucosum]|uniref:hypothetical protein n=1 Tax=Corynebacterium aurimucosum TaxID=169292 RepID=UPI00187A7CA7|nr:hypothetical protein [Corynebacterium aurimucosum]MBE7338096.1 hypothetical protein [Corynebacterium aurimucosum]
MKKHMHEERKGAHRMDLLSWEEQQSRSIRDMMRSGIDVRCRTEFGFEPGWQDQAECFTETIIDGIYGQGYRTAREVPSEAFASLVMSSCMSLTAAQKAVLEQALLVP